MINESSLTNKRIHALLTKRNSGASGILSYQRHDADSNPLKKASTLQEIQLLKKFRSEEQIPAAVSRDNRIRIMLEQSSRSPASHESISSLVKEKIKFGETFMESLHKNEEVYILDGQSVYTLDFPSSKSADNEITYHGNHFPLKKEEDISALERIFFQENEAPINQFKASLLSKLHKENPPQHSIGNPVPHRVSLSPKDELLNEIIYYSKRRSNGDVKKREEPINFDSVRDLQFTEIVFPSIFSAIKSGNSSSPNAILGLFGSLYGLSCNGKIKINTDSFSYSPLLDFEKINRMYLDALEKEVREKLGKVYAPIASQKTSNQAGQHQVQTPKLKVHDIDPDTKILYKELPQYMILMKNKFSLFGPAKIAAAINFDRNRVKIATPGFIFNDFSYYHPFANGNCQYGKQICHGKFAEWDEIGVDQKWQDIRPSDRRNLAGQVHTVIDKLEQVLTFGVKDSFVPGRDFKGFSSVEIAPERAHALQNQGVKVYDNN